MPYIQKEVLLKLKDGSPIGGQAFKALFPSRLLAWFGTSLRGRYLHAVIIAYWCLDSSLSKENKNLVFAQFVCGCISVLF